MDRGPIAKALKRPRTLIALAMLLIAATGITYRTAAILPGCMIVICVVLHLLERPAWASWRARWFVPIVAVAWLVLAVSFLLPALGGYGPNTGAECFWTALQYQSWLISDGAEILNDAKQSFQAGRLEYISALVFVYHMRMLTVANVGMVLLPLVRRWLQNDTQGYLAGAWLACAAAAWAFPFVWGSGLLMIGYYVWSGAFFLFAILWPMNVYRVYLVLTVIGAVAAWSLLG